MTSTPHKYSVFIGQALATGLDEQGFCSSLPVGFRPQLISILHEVIAEEYLLGEFERDLATQIREGKLLKRINDADDTLAPCLHCVSRAGLHRLGDEELVGLFLTPGNLRLARTMILESLEAGDPISTEWQRVFSEARFRAETLTKVPGHSMVSPAAYAAARKVAQAIKRGRHEPGHTPNHTTIQEAIKFRLPNEILAMQRLASEPLAKREEAHALLTKLSDRMEALSAFESEDDIVEHIACDIEWHVTLLQLGGVRYAAQALPTAYEELNVELRSLATPARRLASVDEHREQEKWLLDGDSGKAVRAVYLHLGTVAKEVLIDDGALLEIHEEFQRLGETMSVFLGPDLFVVLAKQSGMAFWWSGNQEQSTPIEYDHFNFYVDAFTLVARSAAKIVYCEEASRPGDWFEDFIARIDDRLEDDGFPRTARDCFLRITVPADGVIDWDRWEGTHAVFLYSNLNRVLLTERRIDQFGRTDTLIRSVPATPDNLTAYADPMEAALRVATDEGNVQAKGLLDRFQKEWKSLEGFASQRSIKQPLA